MIYPWWESGVGGEIYIWVYLRTAELRESGKYLDSQINNPGLSLVDEAKMAGKFGKSIRQYLWKTKPGKALLCVSLAMIPARWTKWSNRLSFSNLTYRVWVAKASAMENYLYFLDRQQSWFKDIKAAEKKQEQLVWDSAWATQQSLSEGGRIKHIHRVVIPDVRMWTEIRRGKMRSYLSDKKASEEKTEEKLSAARYHIKPSPSCGIQGRPLQGL